MRDVHIQLPGGRRVPLSEIEQSVESRAKHLARHKGNAGDVLCLCHREGIPMGVGLRTAPRQTYFLYPLHRSDPPRHAFGCPHRASENSRTDGNETRPVVEVLNGKINVNLTAPSWHGKIAQSEESTNVESDNEKSKSAGKVDRGQLLSLLEVLWFQAELNVWRPYFEGRRKYAVVRHRLLEAADDVLVKRKPLRPRFFMPPVYAGNQNNDQESQEYQRFVDELRTDTNGRQWVGYVAGLLRETRQSARGGASLHLANSNRAFWLEDDKAWERQSKKWGLSLGKHSPDEGDCFVVLRVIARAGRHGAWLAIEEMAVLRITDRHSWLPVDSGHERTLAMELVAGGRWFHKPLSVEYASGEIYPDFILEDRADRMHLEVLGRMTDSDYRAQVEAKRALYQERGQQVWWWGTDAGDARPPIPAALIRQRQRHKETSDHGAEGQKPAEKHGETAKNETAATA